MSAPNQDNPIIDVLERGCADLSAGRRTHAAAAVQDKFPTIARSISMRRRICDRAAPLPKRIRNFTPDRAAMPRSMRSLQKSASTPALLPRFRFEFDQIICRDETNPEPFGSDTIYALWGTIPVAPNAQATSGRVGRYGGMDDGDRRNVNRVMYEGPAVGLSYSIVLYEEDHGNWISAYNEFAGNVARFWNEDVLPLVDDVEDALERVDELPVVGGMLGPLADGARDILRQVVAFIEKIAGWIDTAIRAVFRFLGFEDDPFPEITQTMDLPALLDIPIGGRRVLSHTRSAHGGRYEAKVEITHLPYPAATPGNTSTERPCLLGTDDRLMMLWSGSSSRRELNLRSGREYTNFGTKRVQTVDQLRGEPSAVQWKGKTVVAWVERHRSRNQVMVGVLDARGALRSIHVVPDSRGARGVSACVHEGRLYLMWNGSGTRVPSSSGSGAEAAPLTWRANFHCRITSTASDIADGSVRWSDSEHAGSSYQSPQLVSHRGKLYSFIVDQDGTMAMVTKGSHPQATMMSHHARQSLKAKGPVAAVSHGGELLVAHADRRTGALHMSKVDVERLRVEGLHVLSEVSRSGVSLCTYAGVPHLGWIDSGLRIKVRPFV